MIYNSFDMKAIRIDHKRCVVMGSVVRPQTWQAMIPPTVFKRSRIELIDRFATWRRKSKMESCAKHDKLVRPLLKCKLVSAAFTAVPYREGIGCAINIAPHPRIAKGLEHSVIKDRRSLKARHAQRDMVEHRSIKCGVFSTPVALNLYRRWVHRVLCAFALTNEPPCQEIHLHRAQD